MKSLKKLIPNINSNDLILDRTNVTVQEKPSDNDRKKHKAEIARFSEILISTLNDVDAVELVCPSTSPKRCRCIQDYITENSPNYIQCVSTDNNKEWKTRALELLHFYKEARRLKDEKSLLDKSDIKNMRHNVEYEDFVFSAGEMLKKQFNICVRGRRKLLLYSSIFFHKNFRTSLDESQRIPKKSKPFLVPIQSLVTRKCCENRCTKLAISHNKLLESWRSRAKLSQKDARSVLAEMLTLSGKNTLPRVCHRFIRLITGVIHNAEPTLLQPVGATVIKEINNQTSDHSSCIAVEDYLQLTLEKNMTDSSFEKCNNIKNDLHNKFSFQKSKSVELVKYTDQTFDDSINIAGDCRSVIDNISSKSKEDIANINDHCRIVDNSSNCIQYIPVSVIQSNSSKTIPNVISESDNMSFLLVDGCVNESFSVSSSLNNEIRQTSVEDYTALQNTSYATPKINVNELLTIPVIVEKQAKFLCEAPSPSSDSLGNTKKSTEITETNYSNKSIRTNKADEKSQEMTDSPSKRKSKPLNRFSPDLFKKSIDETSYQTIEKGWIETKPTACESCFVPFKRVALLSKKECRRRFFDPITNKNLLLCNACGVRMSRTATSKPKKQLLKAKPSSSEKNKYNIEMSSFAETLVSTFDDVDAVRLVCPSTTQKLCRCIQDYITENSENCIKAISSDNNDWKARAIELLHLYKEARRLRDQKCVFPVNTTTPTQGNKSGNRNLKRRTSEYEQFVFSTRDRLKKEFKICERGIQRLLIYSNNFLHKQLKSSPNMSPRIPKKTSLSNLVTFQELASLNCCKNTCTKLVISHIKLVQSWRSRAKLSQKEARCVLAEMLTPSAGKSTNCHLFIRLVTGCSSGLLCKVNKRIQSSQGDREPAEHGLHNYWHQRKVKAVIHKDSLLTDQSSDNTGKNSDSNDLCQTNKANDASQVTNDGLCKRKSKPLNRFSPDLFTKNVDETSSLSFEKDSVQSKPTACESCFVPFKRAAILSKKECRRRFFDPITNKNLLLCNACGVRMSRAHTVKPKKRVSEEKPSDDDRNKYNTEMKRFAEMLVLNFDDIDAARLVCPSTTPKLCRCIQDYITANSKNCIQSVSSDNNSDNDWKTRALELLHLYKEARRLRDQKSVISGNKTGNKNLKRRSAEYEQFVFSTREKLKKELKICERGIQKLLIYSNNFLHKRLKSLPNMGPRIPKKPNLSSLVTVQELASLKCCKNKCTKLVISHNKLVQSWRSRAKLSQKEARCVLAEMLTPSAGKSTNCHVFIRLVTGCSSGLLCKVNQRIRSSQGEREPAEHGLRNYWHQRKVQAAIHKGPKHNKEPAPLQPVETTIVDKGFNDQVCENPSYTFSVAENIKLPFVNITLDKTLQVSKYSDIRENDNIKEASSGSSIFQSINSSEKLATNLKTLEDPMSVPQRCTNITDNNDSSYIQYIPVSVIQSNLSKNVENAIPDPESNELRYSLVEQCINECVNTPSSLKTGLKESNVSNEAANDTNELITTPIVLQGQVEPLCTFLPASTESLQLQPTLLWTTSGLFLLSTSGTLGLYE